MHVYIYVCMYIYNCMYVYKYIYTYVYIYLYIFIVLYGYLTIRLITIEYVVCREDCVHRSVFNTRDFPTIV